MITTVTLSTADAIGVGHSLRALARMKLPNAATAETFERVGAQLVAAAQAEIAAPSKGAK